MVGTWVSLPIRWKLEDVQAGLNVCITLLSFIGSFVYVQICWQRAASRIVQGESVPLTSLLTVSNLGEVTDTIWLFWKKVVRTQYVGIWLQCLIVSCLSAIAIFSGPIARYATRRDVLVVPTLHNVSTCTGGVGNLNLDVSEFNATWTRLDNASFPTDQLLDYLPDTTVDWAYNPTQWHSAWSMECTSSQQVNTSLRASEGNCSTEISQFSGLKDLLSPLSRQNYWQQNRGFLTSGGYTHKLLFAYWYDTLPHDKDQPASELHIGLAVGLIRGLDVIARTNSNCSFGNRGTYDVSQNQVLCRVNRRDDINITASLARPDEIRIKDVPVTFLDFFYPRFTINSLNDVPTSLFTTDQLLRFLQVYTILWQTQISKTQAADIDVRVPVVQLSIIFVACGVLLATLSILGFSYYLFFNWIHRRILSTIPFSKIDWMIQSITAEDRPHLDSKGRPRWSATVDTASSMQGMSGHDRRTTEFTAATFSNREFSTWFLGNNAQSMTGQTDNLLSAQSNASGSEILHPKNRSYGKADSSETMAKGATYPLRKLAGYEVVETEWNHRQ